MKDKRSSLEKEIDSVLCEMRTLNPADEKYTKMVQNLKDLVDMRDSKKSEKIKIPWEPLIVGFFGLVQILVITNHERLDTITGKAIGFVTKGRV
jgi:hypothetical protein